MDKLTMEHEMAIAMIKSNDGYTVGGAVVCAWEYVDAMQAETDSRKAEQDRKDAENHKRLVDSLANQMKKVVAKVERFERSDAVKGVLNSAEEGGLVKRKINEK